MNTGRLAVGRLRVKRTGRRGGTPACRVPRLCPCPLGKIDVHSTPAHGVAECASPTYGRSSPLSPTRTSTCCESTSHYPKTARAPRCRQPTLLRKKGIRPAVRMDIRAGPSTGSERGPAVLPPAKDWRGTRPIVWQRSGVHRLQPAGGTSLGFSVQPIGRLRPRPAVHWAEFSKWASSGGRILLQNTPWNCDLSY